MLMLFVLRTKTALTLSTQQFAPTNHMINDYGMCQGISQQLSGSQLMKCALLGVFRSYF